MPTDYVYAGIGSRETPVDVATKMTELAVRLAALGYTLRSGGAPGADTFFEMGAKSKQIFLPWKGFNKNPSNLYVVSDEALALASDHHPAWDKLPDSVKKLMGRNAYQVLGLELDSPSEFLVCWTPDGCESHLTRTAKTGGTGLAISIASKLGIPIYNLCSRDSLESFELLLKALEMEF